MFVRAAQPKRVLIVDSGTESSTGGAFTRAFRALGHEARLFDQRPYFPRGPSLVSRALARVARGTSVGLMNAGLVAAAAAFRPHLLLVMKGGYVLRQAVELIGRKDVRTAVFQNDDVENPLNATSEMLGALPSWDLVLTPRRFALPELAARGVRRAEFLPFSYDVELHRPAAPIERGPLMARAVFVGTWAPERVELFERLQAEGIPLSVFGGAWERLSRRSPLSADVHRAIVLGESLREKLTHAGAAICLVRKANRDLHTMRTFEIPACEGFMVAERTEDHVAMFEEGREAVFFTGADELVATLRRWLPDEAGRRRIAAAGRARVLADGHRYEDRARTILSMLDEGSR